MINLLVLFLFGIFFVLFIVVFIDLIIELFVFTGHDPQWLLSSFSIVKYIAIKIVDKMTKITTAFRSYIFSLENDSRRDVLRSLDSILKLTAGEARVPALISVPRWSPSAERCTAFVSPIVHDNFMLPFLLNDRLV